MAEPLLISLGAAAIGGALFGTLGAQIGWFLGSTYSALLALEDQSTTTNGPRITDFKGVSSKYGIPIFRGYGCARYGGNMIWSGPVTEVAIPETTCETTDTGFVGDLFGADDVETCITVIEFEYYQSAAIAFGEGPADAITRLWADGLLVYDGRVGGEGSIPIVTIVQDEEGNEYEESFFVPFTFYNGTATQGIDPEVAKYTGTGLSSSGFDEAIAFRNIIYIVLTDLDLKPFGYRMPVFNAEICYTADTASQTSTQIPSSVQGGSTGSDYTSLGLVAGSPSQQVSISTDGDGSNVIYDVNTNELVVDEAGSFGGAADTPEFVTLTSNYVTLRSQTVSGVFYAGPFNFITGQQIYWVAYSSAADLAATGGKIQYIIYNRVTARLQATFAGGAMAIFSTNPPTGGLGLGIVNVAGFNSATGTLDGVPLLSNDTTGYVPFYPNAGGTSETGRELFLTPDGATWWLVDGAGGVWINRVTTNGVQNAWRLQFDDATNVASAGNWTYSSAADSFIVNVDVAGTSPAGLYKLPRGSFDTGNTVVRLPDSTEVSSYLNTTVVDGSAFQAGPNSGTLYFSNGTNLISANVSSLTVTYDYGPPADGIGLNTLFSPQTQTIRVNSFNVLSLGVTGLAEPLANIVEDLLTQQDGDPRVRLTPDDIDVTSLTDDVRGFPLLSQQTIRNVLTTLQQGYLFDIVESDGIIKFVKRGSGDDFVISEDALAAHEFNKSSGQGLVPIEFERQSEVELPRELAINYADIDLDYNQGTQRARIAHTDSDSNLTKVLPLTFNADEAAQIADILLSSAWTERVAPFRFRTGPFFMNADPTDNFTIAMNDGVIHSVRIVEQSIGVNGIVEFQAVNDFASLYTSTAVGNVTSNPPQVVAGGGSVEVLVADVPASFLEQFGTGGQSGVVVGVSTAGSGDSFTGGTVSTNGGAGSSTEAATYGFVSQLFGTADGPLGADQFDESTIITGRILGGAIPASCTREQALSGDKACLVIVGSEIIAFTTVTANAQTTIAGTDISFNNATSSIDSVSTDFVAAGFLAGMFLRLTGSTQNGAGGYYEIASLSTNQIVLVVAPVTEAAGQAITITQAGGDFTLSGGILRGLYGTEPSSYHPVGEQVLFAANLFFVTSGASAGDIVLVNGTPVGGGAGDTASLIYQNQNQRPWAPVQLQGEPSGSDFLVRWVRRDRVNGAGIVSNGGDIPSSDGAPTFDIVILDGQSAGQETRIVRSFVGLSTSEYVYTASNQITDWGSLREAPLLVDVYQTSVSAGRGFRARAVVDINDNYQPLGLSFRDELAGAPLSGSTDRWDGSGAVLTSGVVSGQALQVSTAVDGNWGAVSVDASGPAHNFEIYTLVELPAGAVDELVGGAVLRGQGVSANSQVTGFMVGLGGSANNTFAIRQYLGGQSTVAGTYLAQATYAWSTGTVYALRARVYENRIQGKVWVYGEPEPAAWQLDTFDNARGPFFGFGGLFASATSVDPIYHYYAWAHRGMSAA